MGKVSKVLGDAADGGGGYYSSKSKSTKADAMLSSKVGKAEGEDVGGYYKTKATKVFSSKQAKVYGAEKETKLGKAEVSKKEKVWGAGKETKDKLVKTAKVGKSKEAKVSKGTDDDSV